MAVDVDELIEQYKLASLPGSSFSKLKGALVAKAGKLKGIPTQLKGLIGHGLNPSTRAHPAVDALLDEAGKSKGVFDYVSQVARERLGRNEGHTFQRILQEAEHAHRDASYAKQLKDTLAGAAADRAHDVAQLRRKARVDKAVNAAKAVTEANLGLRNAIVAPLAIAGVAVGAGATAYGAAKLHHAITASSDFKTMMKQNPHLEEFRQRDPAFFNSAYHDARDRAPGMMKSPLMAGHLMAQMMQTDRSAAGSVLVNALQTESTMRRDHGMSLGPLAFKPPT